MAIEFVEQHVAAFKGIYPNPPTFDEKAKEGGNPKSWFEGFTGPLNGFRCQMLETETNRAKLLRMSADKSRTIHELCVNILAWGGMHRGNRDRLLASDAKPWIDICRQIWSGSLDRRRAYEKFASVRASEEKAMLGLGPAYFTKLIYFLMPAERGQGFILDQWAGVSVNLMTGRNVVKMDESVTWKLKGNKLARAVASRVSDVNTGADYENFCNALESLSDRLGPGWTPGQVEFALMSKGGKNPEKWRAHVVAERLRTLPPVANV
ncbi:hypothetical protein [Rhizobium leguminosarum]|uniref:8-oxoguanine DNA glycosylase OGG fold protein n=1 Tax=Rhizobium leguminosarum TaxID=384 RepID=UPI00037ED500|nr:hypothetical protein [Rhizobium leguminosarum]